MKTSIQQTLKTLLAPSFYITDFDEMAVRDISFNREEFKALLKNFRADYNRRNFIRDE